jgi:hypothetical protein
MGVAGYPLKLIRSSLRAPRIAPFGYLRQMKRIAISVMLGTLLLAGCAKPRSLVGEWQIPINGVEDARAKFEAGGTMSITARVSSEVVTLSGTYQLQDTTLTMDAKDVDLSKLNPVVRALVEPELKKLKGPVSMKMEWKSDDSIDLSPLDPSIQNLLNQKLTISRIKAK